MKKNHASALNKVLQSLSFKEEEPIKIIIIGHPNIGILSHINPSSLGAVIVCDIDEDHRILFSRVSTQDPVHSDFDMGFYQHPINETNQSLCLIAKETGYMIEYQYEEKNQPIKNYDLPKVGRLNTNPKIIWWHTSHQRK